MQNREKRYGRGMSENSRVFKEVEHLLFLDNKNKEYLKISRF